MGFYFSQKGDLRIDKDNINEINLSYIDYLKQVKENEINNKIRIGGYVKENSIKKINSINLKICLNHNLFTL